MAVDNVVVQYIGGSLPDILLLTQAPIFKEKSERI